MSEKLRMSRGTYSQLRSNIRKGEKTQEEMRIKMVKDPRLTQELTFCINDVEQHIKWMRAAIRSFETTHAKLAEEYKKGL